MAGLVYAVDIGNAFAAALIGALAVVLVSTIVGWVRWLARLDTRLNAINARIDAVEELHVGPSAKDLDDRIAIIERNRGPVLDVIHTRLDAVDKRLADIEKIDLMSFIEALDARLVNLERPQPPPAQSAQRPRRR